MFWIGPKYDTVTKRFILFIIGIVILRVLFVKIENKIDKKYSPLLKILTILPLAGLTYLCLIKDIGGYVSTFQDFIIWNNYYLRNFQALFFFIMGYLIIITTVKNN